MRRLFCRALLALSLLGMLPLQARELAILNVSYDATREFYSAYNRLFRKHWQEKTGQTIAIRQSHGGSGKQARFVLDGLQADVVTLALARDLDTLAEKGKLLPPDWRQRLPHNSAPYLSTIVMVVRKGNPKNIRDWNDLAQPGLVVVTPNPKTSGGARWNYLALWAYAARKFGSDDRAMEFIQQVFANVPSLDTGARGATTTFLSRGIGDVLIAWESDALTALHEAGAGKIEIVTPSVSILAEPVVALLEAGAQKRGTIDAARSYLEYLYSEPAQELIARNYFRPGTPEGFAKFGQDFATLEMITVDGYFGGWKKAQETHFAQGGTFDRIYTRLNK